MIALSDQHTDACARAMEDWQAQWNRDHLADAALKILTRMYERAAARCPACRETKEKPSS